MAKSQAYQRIRAEVIRLVGLIPKGRFTTYGSIAVHMNVVPRHVASVLSKLSDVEAAELPWHRVLSADAQISPRMDSELKSTQRQRLEAEGLSFDAEGKVQNADLHFHVVGIRRNIRWDSPAGV